MKRRPIIATRTTVTGSRLQASMDTLLAENGDYFLVAVPAEGVGPALTDAVRTMDVLVKFSGNPNLPADRMGEVLDDLITAAVALRAVTHDR